MKRSDFSTGDEIYLSTNSEKIQGTLLPSISNKFISIKLTSGYNLSVKKSEVKSMKLIRKASPEKKSSTKIQTKKSLPTISILHTGGTVASKVDYKTGAVSPKFSPQDLLNKFPELSKVANINSNLIYNILSENMRFHNYNIIAKEVEKAAKKAKGIIITHGTDTLHYTAAALSFILENIQIPVILVGSQRSSDRPSADASQNLLHAAKFIAETDFTGIAICMHKSTNDKSSVILPACKSRKLHTSRRDAFKAVNTSPIAIIDNKITFINKSHEKPKEKLKLKPIKENIKIGMLKAHPNLFSSQIDSFKNFDALIIEGTGLGHVPVEKFDSKSQENTKILNSIKKLSKKIPIIMTSQCIFGRTNMNVYSAGTKLKDAGVINDNSDITTETALIKAAWLMSNHKKDFYKLWKKNLRGELNERIQPSHFLEEDEI